jgi:hypothetical protein
MRQGGKKKNETFAHHDVAGNFKNDIGDKEDGSTDRILCFSHIQISNHGEMSITKIGPIQVTITRKVEREIEREDEKEEGCKRKKTRGEEKTSQDTSKQESEVASSLFDGAVRDACCLVLFFLETSIRIRR